MSIIMVNSNSRIDVTTELCLNTLDTDWPTDRLTGCTVRSAVCDKISSIRSLPIDGCAMPFSRILQIPR